jgi:hypothetical protein
MVADTELTRNPPRPTPTLSVVEGENDAAKAARYKEELAKAGDAVCKIITAAKRDGLTLTWGTAVDGMGNIFVAQISASKEL